MKRLGILAVYLFGSEAYEENVVNQYLDFKPVIEYFDTVASKRYDKG
jgi:hypothetical protein